MFSGLSSLVQWGASGQYFNNNARGLASKYFLLIQFPSDGRPEQLTESPTHGPTF